MRPDLLHQLLEDRAALAVGPMEILDDQNKRVRLRGRQHDTPDRLHDALAPCGGVQHVPRGIGDRSIEQEQQRRGGVVLRGADPARDRGDGDFVGRIFISGDVAEAGADEMRDGGERPAVVERRGGGADPCDAGGGPRQELVEQPRLAGAGIADEERDLTPAGGRAGLGARERGQFGFATDERRQGASVRSRVPAVATAG